MSASKVSAKVASKDTGIALRREEKRDSDKSSGCTVPIRTVTSSDGGNPIENIFKYNPATGQFGNYGNGSY